MYKVDAKGAALSNILSTIVENKTLHDKVGKFENTPLIIDCCPEVLKFVVNYMTYYNDKPETPAPDSPLIFIHLSIILGDEYELYKFLEMDKSIPEKFVIINKYLKVVSYLEMRILYKKLSAVVAYLIREI